MSTAPAAEIGQAWKGAHQWREVDPERFDRYADQLNQSFLDSYQVNLRGIAEKTGSLDAAEELGREAVGLIRGGAQEERTQGDRDRGESLTAELERVRLSRLGHEQASAEADGRAGAAGGVTARRRSTWRPRPTPTTPPSAGR